MSIVKNVKKIICLSACFAMITGCLSGCGNTASAKTTGTDDGEFLIVATIYPEYDWVMNVLGDNPAGARVELLLDDGVDMHSYQPTVEDLMKVSSADMFIYVGGESDEWVEGAINNMTNKDAVVINLLDALGDKVYEEETVEGMQEEEHHHHHDEDEDEDEDHDHHDHDEDEDEDHDYHDHDEDEDEDHDHHDEDEDEDHDHHDEEEIEYDEHVWLSLRNAAVLTDAIAEGLAETDKENADLYRSNAESYIAKLDELDGKYSSAVEASANKTILFGDRFPFRYMVSDYGLEYFAAFSGCSAETEASFDTVIFLSKKVDELGLHAVLTIDGSSEDVARTIVSNTSSKDQQILQMNSMQSVTADDIKGGMTYLSVMEENLEVLKAALE